MKTAAPKRVFAAGRVRRTTLHAELAARAKEQDAEWISARIGSVDQDDDGITAAGVRARWLVAADGLHSPVRSAVGIGAATAKPRRYGVRRHFSVPAWSEFVEVHWSPLGKAYVTPLEPDLVGVAILSRQRPDLAWFPQLAQQLQDAKRGRPRGCGPLRQVVSRRITRDYRLLTRTLVLATSAQVGRRAVVPALSLFTGAFDWARNTLSR